MIILLDRETSKKEILKHSRQLCSFRLYLRTFTTSKVKKKKTRFHLTFDCLVRLVKILHAIKKVKTVNNIITLHHIGKKIRVCIFTGCEKTSLSNEAINQFHRKSFRWEKTDQNFFAPPHTKSHLQFFLKFLFINLKPFFGNLGLNSLRMTNVACVT